MAPAARTREEKLFAAAVLKRSLELRQGEERAAFEFVYAGVLSDFGLQDGDVAQYLGQHRDQVDAALQRGSPR